MYNDVLNSLFPLGALSTPTPSVLALKRTSRPDGWTDGRTSGQVDGRMDDWTSEDDLGRLRTNGRVDGRVWTDGRIWTSGRMDEWTSGRMDGRTNGRV